MKPIAIVLGGTAPHIALIQKLQKRGYYVVLFDYLENPPAASSADKHLRISTLDIDAVFEAANQIHPKLVISTCIDQANAVAIRTSEMLGLPRPYTFETACMVTDKKMMKQRMQELGIPTARYSVLNVISDCNTCDLKFPVVIKPADSTGSKGVFKIHDLEFVSKSFRDSLKHSRSGSVILEEFIHGDEIQIDCLMQNGCLNILSVRKKLKFDSSKVQCMQCWGSVTGISIPNGVMSEIVSASNKIATGFKIDSGPFFIQAIVSNNGLKIVEFAARIGGGLSYKIIETSTGFDILDAAINSYLGIESFCGKIENSGIVSTCILYASKGIFSHVENVDVLLSEGVITHFDYYKTKGMAIDGSYTTGGRVGGFIVQDYEIHKIVNKMKTALSLLRICDQQGDDIFLREMYSLNESDLSLFN